MHVDEPEIQADDQPFDTIICEINGVPYELDPETGQNWPIVSDAEMSEFEVEVDLQEGILGTARELVRTEVCSTHLFFVSHSQTVYLGIPIRS